MINSRVLARLVQASKMVFCLSCCLLSVACRTPLREGKVYFGDFRGEGLYLAIGDGQTRADRGEIVLQNLGNRVVVSIAVMNGYSKAVFLNRQPEVVFDRPASVKSFGKTGALLFGGPLTALMSHGIAYHEEFAFLTPVFWHRKSRKPMFFPHGVTQLSWSQELRFSPTGFGGLEGAYEVEKYATFPLPDDSYKIELVVPVTIDYFIVGDDVRYKSEIKVKIIGYRNSKPGE